MGAERDECNGFHGKKKKRGDPSMSHCLFNCFEGVVMYADLLMDQQRHFEFC